MMRLILLAALLLPIAAVAQPYGPGPVAGGGGGTGCVPAGGNATTNVIIYGTAGACAPDTNANLSAGALTLGASGTVGSVVMGNATSGLLTLQPAAGALGTPTVLIPAASDTLVNLASAQALTNKTYNGLTITSSTGTLTVANGKTLTVSNTLTLAGTDGSTLNVGAGGTLGALAFVTPGTGIATALGVNVGSAGAPVLFNGALGTPSSGVGTNLTGTAAGLTAGVATVANGLKSATTTVVVSAATAPTVGQVLTAINGTTADWETISASASSITPGTTTVIGATSPCAIVNTTSTTMGCLLYGLTGNSTLVETTSGGLLTASILPLGTNAAKGAVEGDGQTLTCVAGVCSGTAPDSTKTANYTIAAGDMGGQVNYNGSSITATIPAISSTVLAAGMSVTITNFHATALTISSTPTINGFSGTSIPQFGGINCLSNGTTLDCVGLGILANQALLNGTQTFTGTNTFGSVIGAVNTQSGTTYTLQASDCGKTVVGTNASAITFTTFQAAVVGCNIVVQQGGAGQITFANGGSATLVSAHSYTKTFNAKGATVNLFVDVNGGSAAEFILSGDGA